MATDRTKRCRYCGGTLWRDADVLKCFMCSRPAAGQSASEEALANLSNPNPRGTPSKYTSVRLK